LVKTVLDKLFFHGRVLLSTRRGFRRVYDLPERVLPPAVRNLSRPSATDGLRWGVVLRLRQRRLVLLKKTELPLVEDLVQRVVVDGCPPLHCLREDVPVLEQAATDVGSGADRPAAVAPRLLAPLDPLIYDRRLTKALWNFAYTWEVYLPAAKRQRGYFALPILNGTELAGDVDLKADRARRKLVVVSRRMRRGVAVQRSLRELSAFLGFLSDHRWRRLAGELG